MPADTRRSSAPFIGRWGLLSLVVLLVAGLTYFAIGAGSPVVYQSSDGQWMDCDCPGLKSSGHRGVVFSFERYKVACDVAGVELWRITPRAGLINPRTWFDEYADSRWQVPLSRGVEFPGEARRWPVRGRDDDHCFFRPLSEPELEIVRKRAELYLVKHSRSAESD